MKGRRETSTAAAPAISSEFTAIVLDDFAERVQQVVRASLSARRDAIVHELVKRFSAECGVTVPVETAKPEAEWSGVESLSRLRSVVGGRFQNIKERWVAAGFPLKEHRGEKAVRGAVNQAGWLDLSSWVQKQGFEIRLAEGRDDILFEVRRTAAVSEN